MEMTQSYIKVVESEALSQGIDSDLAIAIASVESNFDPWAVRFESRWKYLLDVEKYARNLVISQDTERVLQSCSWGLMQVMGSVARELGYNGHLAKLCLAESGAYYGCKMLVKLSKRNTEEADLIAAYNAGSARRKANGKYVNQEYVDKVFHVLEELRFVSRIR
jgi:soluble lytic murein transglycosylase-like protein